MPSSSPSSSANPTLSTGKSPRPVTWFEIAGPKGSELQDFYRKLFDWNVNADNSMGYGLIQQAEGAAGIGGGILQCPAGKNALTVYVNVDDLQVALDRATALGGHMVTPPTTIEQFGIAFAHFVDPQGNLVGLVKPAGA